MTKPSHCGCLALLMLILAPGAWSETLVSGNVSGYWTVLGSPYIVVGSITVPANQFLTIQAGVEVRFQGDFNFLVLGGMCAWGNAVDSVKFIANVGQIPSSWKYIEYRDAWPDSARLRYCLIEAGDRAVYADGSEVLLEHCLIQKHAQAPVRGSSAQITLDNSTITNCGASGLSLDNTSAQVLNCDITDSYGATGHGITASNGSDITVNGGYIGNNIGWGIIGVSIGTVDLQNVEIAGNADGGVSLSFGTLFTASRAIIHDNDWHGIYLLQTPADARNMTISGNFQDGIFCSNADLEISSSIIDRNGSWGIEVQTPAVGDLSYNDYFDNSAGNYLGADPGTGSIEVDPLYENYATRNFNLQAGSPCVDTGNPNDPTDPDGTRTDMGALFLNQSPAPRAIPAPQSYQFIGAYPNPFNPNLTIHVYCPAPGSASLNAYSPDGRLAAAIWQGRLIPGLNEFHWRADHLASGVYLLKLESPQGSHALRCSLVR
jgi:hypothetical protein